MKVSDLKPAPGSRRSATRVGRGPASGKGKTSGRGHKGQKSRSGGSLRPGFEGGQMPMQRRLPKRGFVSINRREFTEVNLRQIAALTDLNEITPELLVEKKVIRTVKHGVKLLGVGEVDRAITVRVHAVSKGAREKITAAGGTVEVL